MLKNWNHKYVNNTWLQQFILCRRSMGSLLHWLKSYSTKVKNLQEFNWEWFPLCTCIHIPVILNLQAMRDEFSMSDYEIFFFPFFLFTFFLLFTLWFKLHFGRSCDRNKTEIGEFRFWKGPTSLSLKDGMWYWWSEAFVKLSVLVCFSVTCKEICFISVSHDTVCVKCKRPVYVSKLILFFQNSGNMRPSGQ